MLRNLACACALAIALPTSSHAQHVGQTFGELSAGIATEEEQFSVRSGHGLSGGLGIGRQLSDLFSLEARLGYSSFGAPAEIITPGGCLGRSPCVLPRASDVRITTAGLATELSSAGSGPRPVLLLGVGGRYLTESPERGADLRPYVEAGAGVTVGHCMVRVSYQATAPGRELPKWLMPLTVGYRF